VLINQLEAVLLGLKQMRAYVAQGVEREMLESVIDDGETKLAEIRRKVSAIISAAADAVGDRRLRNKQSLC
jgi:uncharacterized Ntn-hydrolase superfamily protein